MECFFRGIDILPRPIYSPRDIALTINGYDIIKNPRKIKFNNKKELVDFIKRSNNGERYYVHVNWKDSASGHEFIIMNIKNNVYIIDAQAGIATRYYNQEVKSYLDDINYKNSFFVRH